MTCQLFSCRWPLFPCIPLSNIQRRIYNHIIVDSKRTIYKPHIRTHIAARKTHIPRTIDRYDDTVYTPAKDNINEKDDESSQFFSCNLSIKEKWKKKIVNKSYRRHVGLYVRMYVCLSAVCLSVCALQYHQQSEVYRKTLKYCNICFTGMFSVECILKIAAFGPKVCSTSPNDNKKIPFSAELLNELGSFQRDFGCPSRFFHSHWH